MINRLVFENLKHRPVRTLLSALAIGVQVVLMLTLVGVSEGMLHDVAERSRGTGADVIIRAPGSSILTFSSGTMDERIVGKVREQPHVALATGSLVHPVGNAFNAIAGINLAQFNEMSGGFQYIEGGPFTEPHDMIIDSVDASEAHLHAGSVVDFGVPWRVTGIVVPGKMSRMFADLKSVQDTYSSSGQVSVIWVKVDQPQNIPLVVDEFKKLLPGYGVWSLADYVSLVSADNVPMLREFTGVVIGIGAVIGFLVVFLSMYTAVLERTREIGILKALGASPGYVLGILLRETVLLAMVGMIAGIALSYGARALLTQFAPNFTTIIVYSWWPRAGLIALLAALIGAIYPGLKAARQDPIEALSYD